jgi:antitoxin component of MazEF toxin-antitoxin module
MAIINKSTIVITPEMIYQQNELIISMLKKLVENPIENTDEKSTKTWMLESEVMEMLDLKPRSLYELRMNNTLRSSTASGRKVKYLRADVEKYLNDNSNLHSRKRK